MKNFFRIFITIYKKFKNYIYLKINFPDIKIDEHWYSNCLSNINISSCKLEQIKLKDIKCLVYIDGEFQPKPLNQSPMFQYLLSKNEQAYTQYQEYVDERQKEYVHNCEIFEQLAKKMETIGYDDKRPICINKNDEIIDGQHRASYLLKTHGEDYEITVFKIYY